MKLTPDLIEESCQFVNPLKERELDLRGNKIQVIENLAATYDQFDCIDFSDNEIKRLDGFPLLSRISMLLLNNNRVCKVGEDIHSCIPNLETLVLTNNMIEDLSDLDNFAKLTKLKYLSLMRNPVTTKPKYRLYVIHTLPSVRVLDYRKVKQRERLQAERMFANAKKAAKTFTPGEPVNTGPTAQDKDAIRAAIAKASSLDEIKKLEMMLNSGAIPGF